MDEEKHFEIMRMSASRFDDLLRRVAPLIEHAPTHSIVVFAGRKAKIKAKMYSSLASPGFPMYSRGRGGDPPTNHVCRFTEHDFGE